jgi:beta-lactam-binding protein with PASTA domain
MDSSTGRSSRCGECGSELKAGATFCHRCGKAVPKSDVCVGPDDAEGERLRAARVAAQARAVKLAVRLTLAASAVLVVMIGAYLVSTTPVPDLSGQSQPAATASVVGSGLRLVEAKYADTWATTESVGTVSAQFPEPGSRVLRGGSIRLTLAGYRPFAVPTLIGVTFDDAKSKLEALDLVIGGRKVRDVSSAPANTLLETNPPAGTLIQPGTRIDVVVAMGPDIVLPNVVGAQAETAKYDLERLGATVRLSGREPYGKIVHQTPTAGSMIRPNAEINLVAAAYRPEPSANSAIDGAAVDDRLYLSVTSADAAWLRTDNHRDPHRDPLVKCVSRQTLNIYDAPNSLKAGDVIEVRVFWSERGLNHPLCGYVAVWH